MTASWPFAQWGLDIIGPFPIAVRQLKFLVVASTTSPNERKQKP